MLKVPLVLLLALFGCGTSPTEPTRVTPAAETPVPTLTPTPNVHYLGTPPPTPTPWVNRPTPTPAPDVCPPGYVYEAYAGCLWPTGAGPTPTPVPTP